MGQNGKEDMHPDKKGKNETITREKKREIDESVPELELTEEEEEEKKERENYNDDDDKVDEGEV